MLADHNLTTQVPDEDVAIRSVSIASDGGTLVAGNDLVSWTEGGNPPSVSTHITQGMVYVWRIHQGAETTTLQPVTSFQAHGKYITRCLLSPDTK